MGDVSTGDGKDSRYRKKYSVILREYANQALGEPELRVYAEFFNQIAENENITKPQDLMMLDMVCFDFIRIKRLHKILKEQGDIIESEYQRKDGSTYKKSKPNEASYLLNAIESQCRQNMKELLLTRKEVTKKAMSLGEQDLAGWMAKKVVEVEKDDES